MPKKNISINMMRIAGAIFTQREDGTRVLHFELDPPTGLRAKIVPNKNPDLPPHVYLRLDVVDNLKGADEYGNDCFVAEPVTQEERLAGKKLYVGNGWTCDGTKTESAKPAKPKRPKSDWKAEFDEGVDPPAAADHVW